MLGTLLSALDEKPLQRLSSTISPTEKHTQNFRAKELPSSAEVPEAILAGKGSLNRRRMRALSPPRGFLFIARAKRG